MDNENNLEKEWIGKFVFFHQGPECSMSGWAQIVAQKAEGFWEVITWRHGIATHDSKLISAKAIEYLALHDQIGNLDGTAR